MKQRMTHTEAWKDFFKWVKKQPIWKDKQEMPRNVKQYIDRANRDNTRGHLGRDRAKGIIEKFAPGRYSFLDIVELNGEPAQTD